MPLSTPHTPRLRARASSQTEPSPDAQARRRVSRRLPRLSADAPRLRGGGGRRRAAAALAAALVAAAALIAVPGAASASDEPVIPDDTATQTPDETPLVAPSDAPANLDVDVSGGPGAVSLGWDDIAGASEYWVRWRQSGAKGVLNDGERVASSEATIDVGAAGSYVVQVRACTTAGCGPRATKHFTAVVVPPAHAPAGLSVDASAGPGAVALDWDDTPNATEYWVRWRVSGALGVLNDGVRVAASAATVDVGAAGSYVALIVACNEAGCGPRLNEHFTVTAVAPTDRPTGLSIDTAAGPAAVALDWDDVTGAAEYWVRWRQAGPGNPLNAGVRVAVSTATIDVGAAGGYVVLIRACNTAGCGPRLNKHFSVAAAEPQAVSDPPDQRAGLQADDAEAASEPPDERAGLETDDTPTVDDLPGLPSNPDAATTVGSRDVTVTWGAADNATSYTLKWRLLADTEFDAADTLDTTSTSATVTVDEFGTWAFQLEACNNDTCGPARWFTANVEDHPEEPRAAENNVVSPLVSNTGQALGSSQALGGTGGASQAQAFTTGLNASGYALESVEVRTLSYSATGTTVQIATGLPSATNVVATMNIPSGTSTATTNTKFTAPPGITLSPNTQYWVVLAGQVATTLALTSSDNDDSGAAAGFSIADTSYSGGAGSWTQDNTYNRQIRVNGFANEPKIVSNTGQTTGTGTKPNFSNDNAQGFTTGSNSGGYTLTQVDFQISGSGSATFTVDIYEKHATQFVPGTTKVGTLTAVAGFDDRFSGSVDLDANTAYYAVLDVSSHTSGANKVLEHTSSKDNDAGALAGWVVHHHRFARPHSDTSWAFTDRKALSSTKIALYGYSHPPKFVSNTGQTTGTGTKPNFSNDNAQGFTTGSNADGYTLTQVDFQISGSGSAAFTVDIYEKHATQFVPGTTKVGTLTAVAGFDDRFSGSVDLDANTAYYAVLDVSSHTSGANKVLEHTSSKDNDAGALAGWVVHHHRFARPHSDTSWAFTDRKALSSTKIALRGDVKDLTAPSVVSASLVRTTKTLAVTFDEALDDTSVPAAGQFQIGTLSGTTFTPQTSMPAATSRAVVGKVVSLVFGTVATTATHVRYEVPAADPLQDAKGNDVAAFVFEFTGGGGIDYDMDNDGLIEIDSAAKLNAVRLDLNGDGSVTGADQAAYLAAFVDAAAGLGCPASGCKGYELTADVDLSGYANWDPIGGTYTATFEGNGYTIANLTINSEDNRLGLFSVLGSTAAVRNLGVVDARIAVPSGSGSVSEIGVLAGTNEGLVEAVHTTGTVTCERLSPGPSSKCQGVGGLVGESNGMGTARIRRSSSFVDISGPINDGGGLVGAQGAGPSRPGIVQASFAAGDVSGRQNIGGLVGFNYAGQIVASYSVGSVSSTDNIDGGLVGNGVSAEASYYNSETSGQSDKARGVPKTTAELAAPACYCGIYAGWNLDLDGDHRRDHPWSFGTADQYPGLVDVNGVVHRPTFAVMRSAAVHRTKLTLAYDKTLDEGSVPAVDDFTVNVDGSEIALASRSPVSVSGSTVTLTLASSVRAGQTVTLSYAKGTSPIRAADGDVAANLANRAVSMAAPQVRAAVVSRTATFWTMTVELDQPGLLGSFIASAWSARGDNGSPVRPVSGSVDAVAGTVTLNLPATLTWDDTLTVSYRQSGSATTRLRNSAGNPLASFTNHAAVWSAPPAAACTLGPGPDPRNPDSPCGTGPEDISTAANAYKSIDLMNDRELTDPPEPDSVALTCASPNPKPSVGQTGYDDALRLYQQNREDCVITWERPCTDERVDPNDEDSLSLDFVMWAKCRHWPQGYAASFVFKAYLIADLTGSTCTARSMVVERFVGLKPAETATRSEFDLDTPAGLPAGCTVRRWVASVVIEEATAGGKTSGAATDDLRP